MYLKSESKMLILHGYNYVHSDYRMIFDCCYSCAKIFCYPYIKKILTMEIVFETDFERPQNPFDPNYYIDIMEYIDKKIDVVKIYDTKTGEYPLPRSKEHIRNLAVIRGMEAGVKYVEVFRVIKIIC